MKTNKKLLISPFSLLFWMMKKGLRTKSKVTMSCDFFVSIKKVLLGNVHKTSIAIVRFVR
ncbi:hypothetical protein FNE77_11435 [Listeria monocytogenes]|uniref:Uncharacterized protein n=1 Tax=Listeria monocytogenes TaxID=1639 RepID=A0AAN2YLY9_LISMN|nr:hypothetical protein [Listeria monocytogenes]EAC7308400.1 hypothetical protein [Listeria monocytogenes]EAC9103226.1 hypothetical protein [Listeria monocytogenes]EAD2640393.1 hypothetical protein [Listeria monocytogenes]EAD6804834.1 hypothetical protein [Listeria monocytogenes]